MPSYPKVTHMPYTSIRFLTSSHLSLSLSLSLSLLLSELLVKW